MTTTERTVPFTAGDGFEANLVNVRGSDEPPKGPVLLVHGAGVRANIFRAPSGRNIVDVLVTLPPGWVVIAGFNPMHAESAVVFVPPFGCSGPGGGGGGCAAASTPSLTGQPAGRHPDVITCP